MEPINEALSDDCSFSFRPGRSTADVQCYLQRQLARPGASKYTLEVDIRKCFDSIDHQFIIKNIQMNRKILKQWLKNGVMDSENFYYDKMGVPQGGIISPIIGNLVLNGFEQLIKNQIKIWVKSKMISEE